MVVRKRTKSAAKPKDSGSRQKFTLYVRSELIECARGATLWAAMTGKSPTTLSALFEKALERELKRLAGELKPEGGEFVRVSKGLPGGRPRGS